MSKKAASAADDKSTQPNAPKPADDTTPAATADATPADDTTPAATADATPAADATVGDDLKPKRQDKTFTKSELDAAAKKAVDDAKKKWDDEKDLSELERLKKENDELASGLRMRDARDEVVAALTTAGANSPALAFEAIKGNLRFDDAGKLVNSKDLIDALKGDYPEQFGTAKPAEGIDAGAGQGKAGEKLTKEKLAQMKPSDIQVLDWKDVRAVLAET